MRRRSIGKSANVCTEKRIRPKTAMSSDNLEASTTEEDIAAFMESTEVNLNEPTEYPAACDIPAVNVPLTAVALWPQGGIVRQ